MVTCGLSKSYKQFGSENNIMGESICNALVDSGTLSPSTLSSNMRKPRNHAKNNTSLCYNCSECGHRGTIEVRIHNEI